MSLGIGYTDKSEWEVYRDIHSWKDAERVFLEIIADLLGDEERYYNDLKNMCKELIR